MLCPAVPKALSAQDTSGRTATALLLPVQGQPGGHSGFPGQFLLMVKGVPGPGAGVTAIPTPWQRPTVQSAPLLYTLPALWSPLTLATEERSRWRLAALESALPCDHGVLFHFSEEAATQAPRQSLHRAARPLANQSHVLPLGFRPHPSTDVWLAEVPSHPLAATSPYFCKHLCLEKATHQHLLCTLDLGLSSEVSLGSCPVPLPPQLCSLLELLAQLG